MGPAQPRVMMLSVILARKRSFQGRETSQTERLAAGFAAGHFDLYFGQSRNVDGLLQFGSDVHQAMIGVFCLGKHFAGEGEIIH